MKRLKVALFVKFNKKIEHPLYRFCLELFSIIPKRCVNLSTNKIECAELPASGHYTIVNRGVSSISFKSRNLNPALKIPSAIKFEYISPKEVNSKIASFDDQTVISGTDLQFSISDLTNMKEKFQISFAPASRIVALLINPKSKPFDNPKCRLFFANAFRKTFASIVNNELRAEASLSTDILPGYLNNHDLEASATLNEKEIEECRAELSKNAVKWLKAQSHAESIFVKVMERGFGQMGVPNSTPKESKDLSVAGNFFAKDEISVVSFQSGFWALDPEGDIQMLFTPGFAQALEFVTSDEKMLSLVRALKTSSDKPASFAQLNRYMYTDAKFNVYAHARRFFAAKDRSMIAEAPNSITAPAPWQVFMGK